MKAVVLYDSQFGNTEKIAQAIAGGLGQTAETTMLRAAVASPGALAGYDVVVVGSPTQRFHATELMTGLLKDLSLSGTVAAAFDTRFDRDEIESSILRMAIRVAGDNAWAATRIAGELEKAGADVVLPPEGFFVEGTEGPLCDGELERAAEWAAQILAVVRPVHQ